MGRQQPVPLPWLCPTRVSPSPRERGPTPSLIAGDTFETKRFLWVTPASSTSRLSTPFRAGGEGAGGLGCAGAGSAGPASAPQGGRGWQRREAPGSSVSRVGLAVSGPQLPSQTPLPTRPRGDSAHTGGTKRPGPQPLATYPRPAGLGHSPAGGRGAGEGRRDVTGMPSIRSCASIGSWGPSEGPRASGSSLSPSWGRGPQAQSSGLTPGFVPRTRGPPFCVPECKTGVTTECTGVAWGKVTWANNPLTAQALGRVGCWRCERAGAGRLGEP